MPAVNKLEQVLAHLRAAGKMPLEDLAGHAAQGGVKAAKKGYDMIAAHPGTAALGAAGGLAAGHVMSHESDPDEEELKAMIAAMRRGEM